MPPRVLLVQTFYPEFLADLYATQPVLGKKSFEEQRTRVFATSFGVGDAYSHGLRQLGCEASEVICNADILQATWAAEHGLALTGNIHDQRRQIVSAQVDHYKPDVLYVFEWSPLGDAFLTEMKSRVRLLVGQIASPLPTNRTFAAYDLMISSWPPIVDSFRLEGRDAEPLRLGFDSRVLDRLGDPPPFHAHDVTFVGGFAPSHGERAAWLETILKQVDVDVFCYGIEQTPLHSPIRDHFRGQVWGLRMYEILQRSRLTLNRHARIDVRGQVSTRFANNMRLYEATGVGACLITENRENLSDLFEPGAEVVTYDDDQDCIEKIRYYLTRADERSAIARAGQKRTLRDHLYTERMAELLGFFNHRL